MTFDISRTIEPKSDQQNFDDYVAGTKVVTVSGVSAGTSEQPVNIELTEFPGRPYKPSKSMRRVLVAAWGKDASAYVGRQMELFGNPEIRFGKDRVGGIEISRLSHLDKPLTVSLTVTRGKRKQHTVQPLPDPAPAITVADVEACTDVDQLRAWWQTATEDVKAAITARANTLADQQATAEEEEDQS